MENLIVLHSIDVIRRQYPTGEYPVLVMCSDMNHYICKYIRNSTSNQKLVCELIGTKMAMIWELNVPAVAFVNIKPEHWPVSFVRPKIMTTMLGSKYLDSVEYVSPPNFDKLPQTKKMLSHLLKIALFDFWIANEDRNANNSNLLYDISNKRLVPIDFGCILNNADFRYPMMQLTTNETIISSPLFKYLSNDISIQGLQKVKNDIRQSYAVNLSLCRNRIDTVIEYMPEDWNVPKEVVTDKLSQLFEPDWTEGAWNNFEECLNDNI